VKHAGHKRKMRKEKKIVRKPEGKSPLRRPRWKNVGLNRTDDSTSLT